MATKKTWKWAKRVSLVACRRALKLAEGGDWVGAERLTHERECAFCRAFIVICSPLRGRGCSKCPVWRICTRRQPHHNALRVLLGSRTPAAGLRHLRLTIKQLEALDV